MVSATEDEKNTKMPPIFEDVSDVQQSVKAAQQVLKDVRTVFAERAAANRAEKEAAKNNSEFPAAKAKSAPKRRANGKQGEPK